MSWDAYKDNLLGSKCLCEAALFGLDGSVWTCSPGLKSVTPAEAKALVQGFDNPSGIQSGVYIGGTKYMFLRSTSDEIYGKKGQSGVSIAKTNQCMIVGLYKEGQQPGAAALTVGKMQDYLKGIDY